MASATMASIGARNPGSARNPLPEALPYSSFPVAAGFLSAWARTSGCHSESDTVGKGCK